MKSKLKKLSASDAVLMAVAINAGLSSRDGHYPTRLRLDYDTLEVVELRPASYDTDNKALLSLLEPTLKQLRAARKRSMDARRKIWK